MKFLILLQQTHEGKQGFAKHSNVVFAKLLSLFTSTLVIMIGTCFCKANWHNQDVYEIKKSLGI